MFNQCNNKGERGPNYRDLFASPPPPGLVPSCAEGGVLGVLPGIIGSMQALEVIKVITGVGETLNGKLFLFDALSFQSRTFNIKRSQKNPLNGASPTINSLIDHEESCDMKRVERAIKEITANDLYEWQVTGEDFQLIDVREPHEYEIVNIGAELIPLGSILEHAETISHDKKVLIHCKMGGRSAQAIRALEDTFGFTNLYNLKGGILAYVDEIKPELARY